MEWSFTKMQGAGNDFVVLNGVSQPIDLSPERVKALADRHFGIGADQILLVENPSHPEADFRYRIFNADGYEVEHCGNGARCFAHFVHAQKLSGRNPLKAEIATGLLILTEHEDNTVSVDMGKAFFGPEAVDFEATELATKIMGNDELWLMPLPLSLPSPSRLTDPSDEAMLALSILSISNPHAVIQVDDVQQAPVEEVGAFLESHVRFKQRVNVGFMQVLDAHSISLRVYERGVGETLACGTGACAATVAGIRRGLLQSPVQVQTRGGVLTISWDGDTLTLRGPAITVFQGSVNIDQLVKNQIQRFIEE